VATENENVRKSEAAGEAVATEEKANEINGNGQARDQGSGSADGMVKESITGVIDELGENERVEAPASGGDAFEPAVEAGRGVRGEHFGAGSVDILMDVNVNVRVELGRTKKTIGEIMSLNPGMLIELDKGASENVDLYLNDKLFATGEVTVVDGSFAIKITKLLGKTETLRSTY
jgi:flagellar motor switch protein FliN